MAVDPGPPAALVDRRGPLARPAATSACAEETRRSSQARRASAAARRTALLERGALPRRRSRVPRLPLAVRPRRRSSRASRSGSSDPAPPRGVLRPCARSMPRWATPTLADECTAAVLTTSARRPLVPGRRPGAFRRPSALRASASPHDRRLTRPADGLDVVRRACLTCAPLTRAGRPCGAIAPTGPATRATSARSVGDDPSRQTPTLAPTA